jgi:hypothetical protein
VKKNVEIIEELDHEVQCSKIKANLKCAIEIIPLIRKIQQLSLLTVVYDLSVDEEPEPYVYLTEKSRTASN